MSEIFFFIVGIAIGYFLCKHGMLQRFRGGNITWRMGSQSPDEPK